MIALRLVMELTMWKVSYSVDWSRKSPTRIMKINVASFECGLRVLVKDHYAVRNGREVCVSMITVFIWFLVTPLLKQHHVLPRWTSCNSSPLFLQKTGL